MLNELISEFIYMTGFLSLLISLGQFLVVERNAGRYIQALFLFCAGICQIYNGMRVSGFLLEYPHLALVNVPFLYSLGPLIYFYFRYLMHKRVDIRVRYFIHFVPASVILLILMPFYFQDKEFKQRLLSYPEGILSMSLPSLLLLFLMSFIFFVIIIYCISFFRHNRYIFNLKQIKVRKIVYFSHFIVIGVILAIAIYIVGAIFSIFHSRSSEIYLNILRVISVLTGTLFIIIYIMDKRYPDYYNQLVQEIEKIQYQQSRIEGLDIEATLVQLSALMEERRLYRIEDLTLAACAAELEIAPYQLSQLLNEKMQNNFSTYINAYRINEAREIIASNPDRSLSTIGYDVGFNSISTFYSWFCKLTGVPPGKYKERYLK